VRFAPADRSISVVGLAVALVIAVGVAIGGCGSSEPTGASASPSGSVASPTVAPDATTRSASSGDGGGRAVVDGALLDVLPDEIDGFPLTADAETAGEIVADPTTDPAVERLGVGVYVNPGDAVEGDLAIVSVVALRSATFSDAWFQAWRESYDTAACEIAGGLEVGGAEADLADHQTWIGTCQGGVHTYHVYLPDPDRVIAITSLGSNRFGEQVVGGLKE
jgi:hypothetical protein